MRKIKIIADSCSDLSKELLEKYDIDYAKMTTVYNGVESPADLYWSQEDAHKFYDIMRNGERITTAQVSMEEFQNIFSKYLNEGYDIIYIACSSKQSSSVNTGNVVANKLLEENADAKITCIDSLNASLGIALLAVEASKMVNAGQDYDTVVNNVISLRKKINQFVTVHSLTFLKRAGRVKGAAAFFGNLMGVKPILISDANGEQAAYKKVKGRQNSFNEIVSMLKSVIKDPENQTVYIAHADCSQEEIDTLVSLVKAQINCKDVFVGCIGPIIGASIGPDAVGVWGIGEEVTFINGETK
ncbi:MAG: DegV family protein [Clostridia bacterium]|nr:DegV family protein [Clostridia bacterium]